VHKAAVNSQPLDRPVAAGAVNKRPQDKALAVEAVRQVPLDRLAPVAALKQVAPAVAAVVAALKLTLLRQAPETFARFFLTGAGIWACCAAKRKSI
jgi:hypothetical protein